MSKEKEEQLKLVVGSKKKKKNTAGIPISESWTNQSHVKSHFFDL